MTDIDGYVLQMYRTCYYGNQRASKLIDFLKKWVLKFFTLRDFEAVFCCHGNIV